MPSRKRTVLVLTGSCCTKPGLRRGPLYCHSLTFVWNHLDNNAAIHLGRRTAQLMGLGGLLSKTQRRTMRTSDAPPERNGPASSLHGSNVGTCSLTLLTRLQQLQQSRPPRKLADDPRELRAALYPATERIRKGGDSIHTRTRCGGRLLTRGNFAHGFYLFSFL